MIQNSNLCVIICALSLSLIHEPIHETGIAKKPLTFHEAVEIGIAKKPWERSIGKTIQTIMTEMDKMMAAIINMKSANTTPFANAHLSRL